MPVEADETGSFILSANDLCMLEHVGEMVEAGVTSLKIEGRNKGAYYVACVTNAYRHVLDGEEPALWMTEIEATSHRPFSCGFYFGSPTQNPGDVGYARDRRLVAVVDACRPRGGAWEWEVICRNRAPIGSRLCVLSPGVPVRCLVLEGLWKQVADEEGTRWEEAEALATNMCRYRMAAPFEAGAGDMVCLPR